jgi:hypothetical protein
MLLRLARVRCDLRASQQFVLRLLAPVPTNSDDEPSLIDHPRTKQRPGFATDAGFRRFSFTRPSSLIRHSISSSRATAGVSSCIF